jgi:hypothetical protein
MAYQNNEAASGNASGFSETEEDYTRIGRQRLLEMALRLAVEVGLEIYIVKRTGHFSESDYKFIYDHQELMRKMLLEVRSR